MSSVNAEVRRLIDRTRDRAFLTTEEVAVAVGGSRLAVQQALTREVAAGYLCPVRRGLLWKPTGKQRHPYAFDVAPQVARLAGLDDGAGPTGDSARWLLGLADLPLLWVETVPGRAPSGGPGLRFVRRYGGHRVGLTRQDVAVLELLREGPLPALRRPQLVDLAAVAKAAQAERSLVVRQRGQLIPQEA